MPSNPGHRPRLCVFCGSSNGTLPAYREAARTLGRRLAERGTGVVYGGGHVGLMGALADAALDAGGEVVGVIPRALLDRELGHRGVSELHVVTDMHARKALMASLSDAFLALPGGFGTLEELFEAVTWNQLGFHEKPVGLWNIDGFFDGLIHYVDHATAHGFVPPEHRAILHAGADLDLLLDTLSTR